MKSLASSASSGWSSTTVSVRRPNSAAARFRAPSVRAATICGSVNSSVMACPSAMRSGQKATSTPSSRREQVLDAARHAGEDRAAQDDELSGAQVLHQLADRARHRLRVRAEVLVDGRPDDHDDVLGATDDGAVGGGDQRTPRQGVGQRLVHAGLEERRPARP